MNAKQIKPMHLKINGFGIYGVREKYGRFMGISSHSERPWYGGMFYVNGRNVNHLWDKTGRYPRTNYPRTLIV